MKRTISILLIFCFFVSAKSFSQSFKFEKSKLEPVGVYMTLEKIMGKEVLKVIKDSSIKEVDEPTFVKIKGFELNNGIIELKVLSKLLSNAPELARGFIGVAFRINDSNSKFESLYIRPTNGRSNSQLRRNRSTQYFSFPDYKFDRLRKESPGQYESYSDMGLNEWIKLKIVIKDTTAKLYINDSREPCLIVNDLKHGPDVTGAIGLWVDVGTEGYFADLKIQLQ
ncbi:MAG: hypothetical protein ACK4E0_06145 [Chitinophagaceae bacterium]